MQPMKPEVRERLIRQGANPADLDEYERLLAERYANEPADEPTDEDRKREERSRELADRIFIGRGED